MEEFFVADELADEYVMLEKKDKASRSRDRKRHDKSFDEAIHSVRPTKSIEDQMIHDLDSDKLYKILSVLRLKDRELFKLHYIELVSMTKIAKIQGVTKSAISHKLCRIRKRIIELWQKS